MWPVTNRLETVIAYAENPDKTTKSLSKYSKADYQALKDVIAYAKNEEKTESEFFCEGINCNPDTARDQFITVKQQFDKEDGIQAYHGYISFKEQNITPEFAQKVGMEFAKRVWGERFQVVVTTHLNTQHLHCHFVVNSISFVDGKRCQDTSWFKFRYIADEICKQYGLQTIEEPERNPDSKYLTKKEKAGMPVKYNVARAILDEAISMCTNRHELERELQKRGCQFNFNRNHKYWTITIKGDVKPIRLYRLGAEYTQTRIMERLEENRNNVHFLPFQPKTYRPRQYALMTRLDKIKRVGGLYGLYLHYCYMLGTLPKYTRPNVSRMHYLLRPELMKLDEITAQTTLLGRHHIGTVGELYRYKQTVENKIQNLISERTHLRNEIRKVKTTDETLSSDKNRISEITDLLKELRKEVKLCDGIAERSGEIQMITQKVVADQEKEKGKEKEKNEHIR